MKTVTDTADILIVDDTPANLHLLTRILQQNGYKVQTVASGDLALKAVDIVLPDLILLDITMPGMDGYEVCARLKANAPTKEIPVIFISALDELLDKFKAFAVGGVDYITKPFQVTEVLARVKTHLALQEMRRRLEEANARLIAQNDELQARNAELEEALATIKTLSGLVPICAWCGRKIQDEQNQWVSVESYVETHSKATFTHGICPECLKKWKL
ncbi:MAG: response regulator [Anaerolineae bacterium]|jgi:DNA-binding response OmpR family regulator|nr:response regulator [Anaerolineae bacterium]